jgi:hypothetical protein
MFHAVFASPRVYTHRFLNFDFVFSFFLFVAFSFIFLACSNVSSELRKSHLRFGLIEIRQISLRSTNFIDQLRGELWHIV